MAIEPASSNLTCAQCGYQLTTESVRCSECGLASAASRRFHDSRNKPGNTLIAAAVWLYPATVLTAALMLYRLDPWLILTWTFVISLGVVVPGLFVFGLFVAHIAGVQVRASGLISTVLAVLAGELCVGCLWISAMMRFL